MFIEAAGASGTYNMDERRGAYEILEGKSEGKTPFGRHKRTWEDNVKIAIQEIGSVAWIALIWLRTGTVGVLL
jgi:hypothetical protein